MQEGEAGFPCRPHRENKGPLLAAELEDPPTHPVRSLLAASASSSSSSSSSSPSSPSSCFSVSSSSSRSPSSSASTSSSLTLNPPLWQRRSNISGQGRQIKPAQEWHLRKPFSEPALPTMADIRAVEPDTEKGSAVSLSGYRRCMTDTDFNSVPGWPSQAAPDLLQLFNIFQFNKPEKPLARMLMNITLVGSIHPVRLLVAYDASVQDVIKESLKAYVKEGRLPRHCIKNHTYGLHYSPFCLENIDPTDHICSLGTRSFFLFPSVSQLTSPTESSDETKPWWNIFGLMLT
ncbi:hypothetical protein GOP47_0006927 [Adiantum capillus-veneris]|uniref:DUF7054 domain-containing protein n=1 Tax=Adiantum capillus-veneris TaxID=13818 RepID=A0A9D4V0L9_ADICA|nr:hypothetical protein GOP47_0006927 [Adiantum capillus-veneris]